MGDFEPVGRVQRAGSTGVLAVDDVRALQRFEGPWGEITEVANRGGDDY